MGITLTWGPCINTSCQRRSIKIFFEANTNSFNSLEIWLHSVSCNITCPSSPQSVYVELSRLTFCHFESTCSSQKSTLCLLLPSKIQSWDKQLYIIYLSHLQGHRNLCEGHCHIPIAQIPLLCSYLFIGPFDCHSSHLVEINNLAETSFVRSMDTTLSVQQVTDLRKDRNHLKDLLK